MLFDLVHLVEVKNPLPHGEWEPEESHWDVCLPTHWTLRKIQCGRVCFSARLLFCGIPSLWIKQAWRQEADSGHLSGWWGTALEQEERGNMKKKKRIPLKRSMHVITLIPFTCVDYMFLCELHMKKSIHSITEQKSFIFSIPYKMLLKLANRAEVLFIFILKKKSYSSRTKNLATKQCFIIQITKHFRVLNCFCPGVWW